MTIRIQLIAFALLTAFVVASPLSTPARAESAFEDLPAVRNKLLLHEDRHVLAPAFGFTVNDAYSNNLLLGVNWRYYVQSWIGVGLDVSGGFGVPTSLSRKIERELTTDEQAFSVASTSLRLLLHATLELVPIEGKFLLFGNNQLRMDLHIFGGFGMAMVAGSGRIEDEITYLPVIGAGMRFFLSDAIAIGVDVRDYFVQRVLAARRDGGIPAAELTNNMTITLSVGFFLPTEPTIDP